MVVLLTKGLAAISSFTLSIRVLETKFVVIIIKKKPTKTKKNLSVKEMWQNLNKARRKGR